MKTKVTIVYAILSAVHPNRVDEAIESSKANTWKEMIAEIREVLVQFPEEVVGPYNDSVDELEKLADNILAHVSVTLVKAKREFGQVQPNKHLFARKLMSGGYGEFNKRYSWALFGVINNKKIETPKNLLRVWRKDVRPKYNFEETEFINE